MTDDYHARELDARQIEAETRAENDARFAPVTQEPARRIPFGLSPAARFVGWYDNGCYEIWQDGRATYHIPTERGLERERDREAARQDAGGVRHWDTTVNRYPDESYARERRERDDDV